MILQIILVIMVVMVVAYIGRNSWLLFMMLNMAEDVFLVYENSFDIYLEEKLQVFPPNCPQRISCGKIRFEFSNAEEACVEFEKVIDEFLAYYNQYEWLVQKNFELQSNREELNNIKQRILWLKR